MVRLYHTKPVNVNSKILMVTNFPSVRYNLFYESFPWHDKDATIPFKLTFKMPIPDHGKRGYSDKYIDDLKKVLH